MLDVRDQYVDHGVGDWSCRQCWALVRFIFLEQHIEWHESEDS